MPCVFLSRYLKPMLSLIMVLAILSLYLFRFFYSLLTSNSAMACYGERLVVFLLSSQTLMCSIGYVSVVAWPPNAQDLPNKAIQECKSHYHTLHHRNHIFYTARTKIYFYPIKHKSWQFNYCCRTLACAYDFSLGIKTGTRPQQSSLYP